MSLDFETAINFHAVRILGEEPNVASVSVDEWPLIDGRTQKDEAGAESVLSRRHILVQKMSLAVTLEICFVFKRRRNRAVHRLRRGPCVTLIRTLNTQRQNDRFKTLDVGKGVHPFAAGSGFFFNSINRTNACPTGLA